jgi:hypothetical protein
VESCYLRSFDTLILHEESYCQMNAEREIDANNMLNFSSCRQCKSCQFVRKAAHQHRGDLGYLWRQPSADDHNCVKKLVSISFVGQSG